MCVDCNLPNYGTALLSTAGSLSTARWHHNSEHVPLHVNAHVTTNDQAVRRHVHTWMFAHSWCRACPEPHHSMQPLSTHPASGAVLLDCFAPVVLKTDEGPSWEGLKLACQLAVLIFYRQGGGAHQDILSTIGLVRHP